MLRSTLRSIGLILALLFTSGLLASAQIIGGNATLTGTVNDPQNFPTPKATVIVTNQATKASTQVLSDDAGVYTVSGLPAGTYSITVRAATFADSVNPGIAVNAGQKFTLDIQLRAQAAGEEIIVTAETPPLNVENAGDSITLGAEETVGIPTNGRSPLSLIGTTPGVSDQSGQDEKKVGVAGSAKTSVNGGRDEYNTFEIDGVDTLNTSINASRGQGLPLEVYPSLDAIDSVKIVTADYRAIYGGTASGSVLLTTKSGGEKFHGVVYEFLRNEVFNARNYFDAPGRTPLYRRQDFGFTLGGPLFIPKLYNTAKTKTFFFWSEEFRLEKTPVAYNQAVPTVLERQGDFSDVCPAPGSTNFAAFPDCPQPSGGGDPRKINVNYTAAALLSNGTIPLPNAYLGCDSTNPTAAQKCYVASISPPTYFREELFRIDHHFTESEILAFRYVHDSWDTTTLAPQWGVVQNSFPTVQNRLFGPGLNMLLSLTQALPHNYTNRIGLSYSVEHISLAPQAGTGVATLARAPILSDASPAVAGMNPLVASATAVPGSPGCSNVTSKPNASGRTQTTVECPMGSIFANGFNGGLAPGLSFQGNNGAYGGHGFNADTGFAPWHQSNPTVTLRDDATKQIGNHNLQFGGDITFVRANEQSAVSGANSGSLQGLLTFSNQQSRYTTQNAFADFLTGPAVSRLVSNPPGTGQDFFSTGTAPTAIKSYQQDSGRANYDNRYKAADLYLQDDWRVTKTFTLNVGFRAGLFGTWYNAKGNAFNWEPNAYSDSLGRSISVDNTQGYLVRGQAVVSPLASAASGLPLVPLDQTALDPTITNGLVNCGKNGIPKSCQQGHLFNPSPRVGFTWDVLGHQKTYLRAGYGLFWEHGTSYESNVGSLIGSAPIVLSETQSNPTGFAGNVASPQTGTYNQLGFSCQGGPAQCNGKTYPGGATFPLNVTSIPTKAVYTYAQQWSLGIEQAITARLVLNTSYVGAKGTHLTATQNLNQLPNIAPSLNPFAPGQPLTSDICASGASTGVFNTSGNNFTGPLPATLGGIGPGQPGYQNLIVACTGNPGFKGTMTAQPGVSADSLRRYRGFSNVIAVRNIADSEYNAFQLSLRRTGKPIDIALAYTYSHSLDDSSDRASASFADSLNIKSNHANSDFDQRHIFNISYVYDLPLIPLLSRFAAFTSTLGDDTPEATSAKAGDAPVTPGAAPARRWQDAPLLKTLLDGWQLSGITNIQTGTPFSVINGGGLNGLSTQDNPGVGAGIGVGSFADKVHTTRGIKPLVATGSSIGPLIYDPSAYAAPRALSFGNAGRNSLNNPGRTNFNAALLKTFRPFGEGRTVEFRGEAFNIFNHTQFRIYDPTHPGNTGNNIISSYGGPSTGYSGGTIVNGNSFLHPVNSHDPRILQFGLKLGF